MFQGLQITFNAINSERDTSSLKGGKEIEDKYSAQNRRDGRKALISYNGIEWISEWKEERRKE